MKNRNMMLAVAAAAVFAGGMGATVVPASAQITASSPTQPGGNTANTTQGGSSATARQRFASGGPWSSYASGYRRRPARTVAQDKRDAARVRNKRRRG